MAPPPVQEPPVMFGSTTQAQAVTRVLQKVELLRARLMIDSTAAALEMHLPVAGRREKRVPEALEILDDLAADVPVREHHLAVDGANDARARLLDDRDHTLDERGDVARLLASAPDCLPTAETFFGLAFVGFLVVGRFVIDPAP